MTSSPPGPEPLLRTLAPLLRNLERDVRGWFQGVHRLPLPLVERAHLEGLLTDLQRQADILTAEQPLLVIMLMGGTGVGKSTLLNALAGAPVAEASVTRPTTRDPVVYYHDSLKPDQFDAALRLCRLVPHHRPHLRQKILVDTPDLDSNDLSNRERLKNLLPVADIVLYVGSQEKYHDQLGWELFLEHRQRRAFAFVLNKWDRCLQPNASGKRPDEDLLEDLRRQGFQEPLIFRTMAQAWIDAGPDQEPTQLPPGEQFRELRDWLELGLTRLEIEAVKARGVQQLLSQLEQSLERVRPPDLTEAAQATRLAWEDVFREEAESAAAVLVGTLEPYAAEIEHHFRVQGQQQFRGLMAGYLKLTTRLRYAGTSLRDRLPLLPRWGQRLETPQTWNLAAFAHECTRVAGERVLNQRTAALANRLAVEADRQRLPIVVLQEAISEAGRTDWQARFDRALMESLAEVERNRTRPRGLRKLIHGGVVLLSNVLPELVLVASFLLLLWYYFMEPTYRVSLVDLLLPFALTLVVLVLLQIVGGLVLPVRWSGVRDEFRRCLSRRIGEELAAVYASIPAEVADALRRERAEVERLVSGVRETQAWLAERQSQANIGGLYGR